MGNMVMMMEEEEGVEWILWVKVCVCREKVV